MTGYHKVSGTIAIHEEMKIKNINETYSTSDSPRRYFILHWLSGLISLVGICGLVVARGHYR